MAYEPKDMTGSLFKNDRKERDTHPDYKGSALINGVDHWLDAWINEDRNGNKYMSLKLKPKEARGFSAEPPHERGNAVGGFMEDETDIPF
jgi:uncharacterized protein (DUF736 family)